MRRWSVPVLCLVLGLGTGSFVASPLLLGQNPGTPAVPKELTSYRDVVKKVLPAVVSIEGRVAKKAKTDSQTPRRRFRMDDPFLPEEFRKFFEEFENRQFDMDEI